MRSTFHRFAAVLVIMMPPAFLEQAGMRIGALLGCLALALVLVAYWHLDRFRSDARRSVDAANVEDERVRHLSRQLRDVVDQTEAATLEINERVLSIIGRARAQQRTLAELVSGISNDRSAPAGGSPAGLAPVLEAMAAETASLSRDVNNVVMSLQFQDLTKQRLEKVIDGLQDLRREFGTACCTKGIEEPFEKGRRDGKDLSDR